MKRILSLLRYIVIVGIMLYAVSQLYQPPTTVKAGACCKSDAGCDKGEACISEGDCTNPWGECTVKTPSLIPR